MPYFLQQWSYKDEQVATMIASRQDRKEALLKAVELFGGKLHQFFFCFGEYDGVAITEYPDNETAMASLMSVYGNGRLRSIKTTVLLTPDESRAAVNKALEAIKNRPKLG